jgi:hypothetical protein
MPPDAAGRDSAGLGWGSRGRHGYLGILRRGEASSAMTSDTMFTQT